MRHHSVPLREVPAFSTVRVLDFGSIEECRSASSAVDDEAAVWTRSERDSNPFAMVEVVGLIDRTHGLVWIPEDATVEVVSDP